MQIQEFVSNFRNHPIMFIGTGLSIRYLSTSYTWENLLKKIVYEFESNEEYYLDLKHKYITSNGYDFAKIAAQIESDFNKYLQDNRNGKFKRINDYFYENMKKDINVSRFKLYISELLKDVTFKDGVENEIAELKKAKKNIGSVITTNYDRMIEEMFSFTPLIGNDILLSNPYGSVYKIHGCVTEPDKIIITEDDYKEFKGRYELIRAQLLSLFIHNPIIFIGYNIGDKNIKDILKTIFSYVNYNSEKAKLIRDNFLLVEFEKGSTNVDVVEHDIDIDGFQTIRINKLKTDNFTILYNSLSNINLPISTMDIRKVENVVRDIHSGGDIKVSITEDLDSLKNSDKVLVIGSTKTIKYEFQTISEMMVNYFQINEESNYQLINLINKQLIQNNQYFPIYAFSKICPDIQNVEKFKIQQQNKINTIIEKVQRDCMKNYRTPKEVLDDNDISQTNKVNVIVCNIMNGSMDLESVKNYLQSFSDKRTTNYRKILCAYDMKCYST